jgi:hypothetical protein
MTDKERRIKKRQQYMHRHAMQKFTWKFKFPRKDVIIHSINVNDMDKVHLVLPKRNVMSSLREYKLMDMYTKLCGVMVARDVSECPTPGM